MKTDRDAVTRVDDGILVAASHLARLRGQTLRGSVEDFRQTCVENAELALGLDDAKIWRLRVERCNLMLSNPDDIWLRRRTSEAIEADR